MALFHDGAKLRAEGREAQCLERMRESFAPGNLWIEPEWYPARHEVEAVDGPLPDPRPEEEKKPASIWSRVSRWLRRDGRA